MTNMTGVLRLLEQERDSLTKELRGITAALAAFGHAYVKGVRHPSLSFHQAPPRDRHPNGS